MKESLQAGFAQASALFMTFVPKLLLAVVVIVAAYFIGKMICRVLSRILDKVGFNRLVERGGIKRALDRSGWDAGQIVSKVVFYFIMLCALQVAFGVFGPNPVSDILTRIVAFLPNVIAAMVIVVLAAAVATAVKNLAAAALGALSYGKFVANAGAAVILFIGIAAALNQVGVAPAIVNGVFYAVLAALVGVTIVAVGGGGIQPMRQRWERALGKMEEEAPRIREATQAAGERIQQTRTQGPVTSAGAGSWADEVEDQRAEAQQSQGSRRRRSPPRE